MAKENNNRVIVNTYAPKNPFKHSINVHKMVGRNLCSLISIYQCSLVTRSCRQNLNSRELYLQTQFFATFTVLTITRIIQRIYLVTSNKCMVKLALAERTRTDSKDFYSNPYQFHQDKIKDFKTDTVHTLLLSIAEQAEEQLEIEYRRGKRSVIKSRLR